MGKLENSSEFEWVNLDSDAGYQAWRAGRLDAADRARHLPPVAIGRLGTPTTAECAELARRCSEANFARYRTSESSDPDQIRSDLRRFSAAFGLRIAEVHRSAGEAGIVALQPSDDPDKRGYIPYSTRPMNWHTDGYYNAADHRISAFVLHCVAQAGHGGGNQILNPEVAYIRLRDRNPDYVRALMRADAMSIPENRERDGRLRPVSVGPVFYPDPETGRLQMRYTARTRSIDWHDDPLTVEATACLAEILQGPDALTYDLRLDPGEGILNNNVLHNRTAFSLDGAADQTRLVYRVRFLNRIGRIPGQ